MTQDSSRRRCLFVCSLLGLGALAEAQVSWTQLPQAVRPAGRNSHTLTYDPVRGEAVLFGGGNSPNFRNDTWVHDGANWQQRFPATQPSARWSHAAVFDVARGKIVLFGGNQDGLGITNFGDTWEWDGTNWTQLQPANSPPARLGHELAYDTARQRVVLFGGQTSLRLFNDTWEWDGTDWTQLTPANAPTARCCHSMTYDPVNGVTVLFGGRTNATNFFGDTWLWDGTDWSDLGQSFIAPRWGHKTTYDSRRQLVVLYGGYSGVYEGNTWEWDGANWLFRNHGVAGDRCCHGLAYNAAENHVLRFGGSGPGVLAFRDTWIYENTTPANLTPFGVGCAGSAGLPGLVGSGGLPWTGETFDLVFSNLIPGQSAYLMFGGSNTVFGASPLPLAMDPFGAPGCSLLVSLDLALPFTLSTSTVTFPVSVPDDRTLVGGTVYVQGGVLDPPANPLGLVFSNGVGVTIGVK